MKGAYRRRDLLRNGSLISFLRITYEGVEESEPEVCTLT